MNLNGAQARKLSEALQDAFDMQSLREMLAFSLDKKLASISGGGSLREVVFELIEAAAQEGWTEDLVRAAAEFNPGNATLQAFATSVGIQIRPGDRAAPPPVTPADAEEQQRLGELLRELRRRLHARELTAARYGIDAPVHVTIEIEDLRAEISALEQRLR